MIDFLKEQLLLSDAFISLSSKLAKAQPADVHAICGVPGSLRAILAGLLAETLRRPVIIITADDEEARKKADDLSLVVGQQFVRTFTGEKHGEGDGSTVVDDIETLKALIDKSAKVVISTPRGLSATLPTPASLRQQLIEVERERDIPFERLLSTLVEYGFEKVQFVESVGEFSVRGGILDIFPFVGEHPLRIEFFGDTVESLREFDPISQRSIKELQKASIVPNLVGTADGEATSSSSLLDFVDAASIAIVEEPDLVRRELDHLGAAAPITWEQLADQLQYLPRFDILSLSGADHEALQFEATPQPAVNGSIKVLRKQLASLQEDGYAIYISSDTETERDRLKDLLAQIEPLAEDEERRAHEEEHHLDVEELRFSLDALHEGFVFPALRLAVFTEHQIFNRLKRRGKQRRARFKGITQRELHELRKGDFVVHADYGIGRFDGLKKIKVRDIEQEVVKLSYEEKDTLYVNLNYLTKVQKYSSKEGYVPKLTRLGSGEWDKLKARAKKRVKDIARDLIKLYAKRKHSPGFTFGKDTLWQRELEASFMYEDTPDQAKTTAEIKEDMEASFPMDRLVCGDVGFGKTEVAVRAAFKAVMSGKQVAVLVPTTILAQQHYNTFVDRLAKYSTRVEVISRFKTKKEQGETIARLKAGTTDIIIGTHRLLSKDIGFKDLGLLIVDEEHRFGVSAKEKLRQIRINVDTLTLTATPIPRTLHFSLMGARDLSIIATPPPNRRPVITEISEFHEDQIRDAILREVHRGGQVFFVHDRINNIEELVTKLQQLLPQVRFRSAHGQMHAHELEEVMLAFLEKRFDVLVATKIIESGIDIPNVNTIVINRADRFGMAELYQLRGRVGRSNVQAYAYLLTPPISTLPRETIRRLQAIEEFTELGSGFNLAMRDLEIRGAGNLLGAEQSGYIESMGFELYTKILEEAVAELKEEEFRDLFAGEEQPAPRPTAALVEADIDVRIPETYIESDNERLNIYRRLYSLSTEKELGEVAAELVDRFGEHPVEVQNLINLVRIRLKASALGFRKVNIDASGMQIEFPPESEKSFYESESFQNLMTFISTRRDRKTSLSQNGKSLTLASKFKENNLENSLKNADFFIDELIEASQTPAAQPV